MAYSKNSSAYLVIFFTLNLVFMSLYTAMATSEGECRTDTLKLGVCLNVLNGLIKVGLGKTPVEPCCSLIQGLADLEAAACLCSVLKANVLGIINLNIPVDLSILLGVCNKNVPSGFQCA